MKKRSFSRLFAFLLFALLLCAAAAEAETLSGQCGFECEMTWTLTDGGRLDIDGEGPMQDYLSGDDVPWKDYREQITRVAMGKGVQSIGSNAFYGCSNLKETEIPEGVTAIGDSAFRDCVSLLYALLPNSVTAIGSSTFEGCGNLSGAAIPAGVTSIGASAFRGCANLDGIIIPAGVAQISDYTFYGCSGLGEIVIPYGVTEIGSSAFEGCGNLRYVAIPASVTEIRDDALPDCLYFGTIGYGGTREMWEAVTIGQGNDCLDPEITEFIWGGTVAGGECGAVPHTVFWTLSGDGALNVAGSGNMKNYDPDSDAPPWYSLREAVTSVTVESGVRTVGNSAFSGCIQLEEVNIHRGLASIGSDAFLGCVRLEAVNIQGGVTSVGSGAFQGCAALTDFAVPVGVREINSHTFDGCTGLQSVTIPLGVTAIGEYAFDGCAELTAVSIPFTMEEIGEYAFAGCSNLEVQFDGTEEMWAGIRIGDFNDSLSNAGIQYGCAVASGECGADGCTVFWTLSQDGALSIAGEGNMRDYEEYDVLPWDTYLKNIRSVAIGSGVTSIGNCAFWHCVNLASISIPDTVTSIGESAIRGCRNLTSVTIPEGVTSIRHCTFDCCGSLESVTLPAGLKVIADHAFDSCVSLETVAIPVGVTSITEEAFHWCTGLESVTIPVGMKQIQRDVFKNCSRLKSVAIPVSVTEIVGGAFSGCEALEHVWYDGTQEMWNSIRIGNNNDYLKNAELHCRFAVSIECGAGGTVKADKTIADENRTVTLTVKPAGGYELDKLTAACLNSDSTTVNLEKDTADPNKWTFRMPNADVKVTAAFALNSARYLDEDGLHIPAADVATLSDETEWNTGWYLASSETEISGRVSVTGSVQLILADGADLSIPGGITVPSGSRLTVYAQSAGENMGKLTAGVPENGCTTEGAGIGGALNKDCGEIVIVGGQISARGSGTNTGGAGIGGGGKGQSGGSVTIRGGDVTAIADRFSAAIGAGYQGKTANVTIIDGTVIAESGTNSAAIGGGQMSPDINLCDIEICISGGTVTARKTDGPGAGIGAGYAASSGKLNISITGGKVTATGGTDRVGIGRAANSGGCAVTLGWTKMDDFIESSSYYGVVKLSKNFEGDDGAVYAAGEVSDNAVLTGKKLRATDKNAIVLPESTEHGSVTASAEYASPGESVVVTLSPDEGYAPYSLTVTQENGVPEGLAFSLNENGEYMGSFNMPGARVTVEAAFALAAVSPTVQTQDLALTYGYSTGSVSVTAAAAEGHEITFWQWYSCEDANKTNPIPIEDGTGAEYTLPLGKRVGTTEYYFCAVTAARTDNGLTATAESDVVTVTVGKAPANVTPDAKGKIVDKKDPILTATVTGTIGEETLRYTLTRDEGENEGEYAIRVVLDENPNYAVTVNPGTFTIVPPFSGDFVLPKETKTIGASAFAGLKVVTGVDAGSCAYIGKDAFKGCTSLKQIRVSKICAIEDSAFDDCPLIAIYGPGGGDAEQRAKELGIPFADEAGE